VVLRLIQMKQETPMNATRVVRLPLVLIVALVGFALIGCSSNGSAATPDAATPAPTTPAGDGERREEPAPIESIDVLILESFPVQYNVEIVSGLPSGCAEFERYEVKRDGTAIEIIAWNTMPASDDVACTMIYGYQEGTVSLGSDFEPGTEYTVTAGDLTETFVAQ
jgi:inhibitor of cysteine peptidase